MSNLYEILEVSEKASKEVIDKAYHVLVKKYHPDLQQAEEKKNAEEKMKEINEAYEVLSNEEKRKEYDISLEEQREQEKIVEEQKRKQQIQPIQYFTTKLPLQGKQVAILSSRSCCFWLFTLQKDCIHAQRVLSSRSCSISWHSFSPWHNLSKLSSAHVPAKLLYLVVYLAEGLLHA